MLTVNHLRKEFDGIVAVNDLSFTVDRGAIFGLLGPNGAGKTTTIRTILHIIKPDSGEILFNGLPFLEERWNTIGYLPEERGLYRKSRVLDTILYFASLKGFSGVQARHAALKWLERFGLKQDAHRKVEELSKGNQQKVQLIIALIHRPQLLVLDEPFSGLDPINQQTLKEIILELSHQNTAIIFSTHQMEQVEKLCDSILLMNKGKEILQGSLMDVKQRYGSNSIHIEFEGDVSFLQTLPFVKRADVYQRYAEIELEDMSKSNELLTLLSQRITLRKFELVEPSLHSIFLQVVGEENEPREVKSL